MSIWGIKDLYINGVKWLGGSIWLYCICEQSIQKQPVFTVRAFASFRSSDHAKSNSDAAQT
jgi:hypothetical protein